MAEPISGPSKRTVIEALVLAFSHSDVSEIVGTDALRTVLAVEYHDLTATGSLELQQLWELLEEQPGFEADLAIPPMLLIKQWERQLGLSVVLPASLKEISTGERSRRAAEITIPTPELRKLFRTDLVEAEEKQSEEKKKEAKEKRSGKGKKQSRPALLAAAAVVAVLAFAFTGFTVYKQLNQRAEWKGVNAKQFAGDLPIRDAKQFGAQVGAVLTDAKWIALSEDVRRSHLRIALETLRKKDINVLFLRDSAGRVQATVQYTPKTGSYSYTFPGHSKPPK